MIMYYRSTEQRLALSTTSSSICLARLVRSTSPSDRQVKPEPACLGPVCHCKGLRRRSLRVPADFLETSGTLIVLGLYLLEVGRLGKGAFDRRVVD
jgi:hypothetical protein